MMYELWEIKNGTQKLIDQERDAETARTRAIEESNLRGTVIVVMRQGFGEPLSYAYQGQLCYGIDVIRRMTIPPLIAVKPVVEAPTSPSDLVIHRPTEPAPRRRKGPQETKARKDTREFKVFPTTIININEAQGIVEEVINTYGIVDDGSDRVWYGSASKTLAENFGRIRVLNSHNNRNVLDVVGKPVMMRELTRDELPPQILQKWPEATGGLYAKTQYLIDTPEGLGVFKRIVSGAVAEYSIGFDTIISDMERVVDPQTQKQRTIRNIREIRLWEYSPVVWGMNPGTGVVSIKSTPSEQKPYAVFPMHDEFCVFKIDDNGERMGDSLGCHATESEAQNQVEALYASEADGQQAKEMSPEGPIMRFGDMLVGRLFDTAECILNMWLIEGWLEVEEQSELKALCSKHIRAILEEMPADQALRDMTPPMGLMGSNGADEIKVGRVLSERNYNAIKQAHELLTNVMQSAGLNDESDTSAEDSAKSRQHHPEAHDGPPGSTDAPTSPGAGPQENETPATTQADLLKMIEQRLAEVEALDHECEGKSREV
jgi:hypothetical protein